MRVLAAAERVMIVDKSRRRRGFTLIEILIVMTILIILAGLAAVASRTAITMSRNSATKVLLAQIQAALDEKMQKFMTDTQANMPIDNYRYFAGHIDGNPFSPSTATGQRAGIIARMDMMRSAFPQSFSEMVLPQSADNIRNALQSANSTNFLPVISAFLIPSNTTQGSALAPVLSSYPSHQSIFIAYLLGSGQITKSGEFGDTAHRGYNGTWSTVPLVNGRLLANNNPVSAHDPETESAECLYLILADKAGGTPSIIDELPSQFIKDTDGDGLWEIVDSWGKPIKFYRWSTDTFAYFIEVTQQYKGVGKPGDVTGDGVADTIVGSNSLDPNNLLYNVDPTWFGSTTTGSIGSLTANVKDIFECLFGRLHGAYSYEHGVIPTSLTPPLDTAADAIDYNAVNNRNEHNAAIPRSYPFRSLVVSAGSDGQFGMYDLKSETPNAGGTVGVTYPQIHIGMRCGRVEDDVTKRPYFNDNVFSIDLQEGVKQ
ncbi:type II secretion system GspH family protein [bacterium]|nr:type II secretion system GspH family protein [bacterium]